MRYVVFFGLTTATSFHYIYKSDPATLPYTSWMSYFHEFYLGDLPIIPGTHDSGAVTVSPDEDWLGIVGWLFAKTQYVDIMYVLL